MVISLTTRTTRFHFVIINIWAYQSYLVVCAVYDSAGWVIVKNRQSDFLFSPFRTVQLTDFEKFAALQLVIIVSPAPLWT
jgi:hypothetical protein